MIKNLFYSFMYKLRLAVTIIVALFIVAGIYGVLGISNVTNLTIWDRFVNFIFTVISCLLMFLIVYFLYGKKYQCPSCNKRFCLKKTGEEVVKREDVFVAIEANTRNRNGEVIGSQEQYVPGERITYRVNKVCKKCGEGCYSTYRKDIPKV